MLTPRLPKPMHVTTYEAVLVAREVLAILMSSSTPVAKEAVLSHLDISADYAMNVVAQLDKSYGPRNDDDNDEDEDNHSDESWGEQSQYAERGGND